MVHSPAHLWRLWPASVASIATSRPLDLQIKHSTSTGPIVAENLDPRHLRLYTVSEPGPRRGDSPAHTHPRPPTGLPTVQHTPTAMKDGPMTSGPGLPTKAWRTRPPYAGEASQRVFSSSQLHPRPVHPSSSMVMPVERPNHRRDRHDRAIPSAEPPCRKAAFSSTAQTSMSARARRASASPSRPIPSEHATAKCFTCTGLHTGTLRG